MSKSKWSRLLKLSGIAAGVSLGSTIAIRRWTFNNNARNACSRLVEESGAHQTIPHSAGLSVHHQQQQHQQRYSHLIELVYDDDDKNIDLDRLRTLVDFLKVALFEICTEGLKDEKRTTSLKLLITSSQDIRCQSVADVLHKYYTIRDVSHPESCGNILFVVIEPERLSLPKRIQRYFTIDFDWMDTYLEAVSDIVSWTTCWTMRNQCPVGAKHIPLRLEPMLLQSSNGQSMFSFDRCHTIQTANENAVVTYLPLNSASGICALCKQGQGWYSWFAGTLFPRSAATPCHHRWQQLEKPHEFHFDRTRSHIAITKKKDGGGAKSVAAKEIYIRGSAVSVGKAAWPKQENKDETVENKDEAIANKDETVESKGDRKPLTVQISVPDGTRLPVLIPLN